MLKTAQKYLDALNNSHVTQKLTEMLAEKGFNLSGYTIKEGTARVKWDVVEVRDKEDEPIAYTIMCQVHATRLEKKYKDFDYARRYTYATPSARASMEKPEQVDIEVPDCRLFTLVKWTMQHYPACCAMYQANYFACSNSFPDLVSMAATLLWKEWLNHMGRADRLIFNFVERGHRGDKIHNMRNRTKQQIAPIEGEFTPENIDYWPLYNWAKAQAGFQEMLCYNSNSGHIIHTALVVLDPNQ